MHFLRTDKGSTLAGAAAVLPAMGITIANADALGDVGFWTQLVSQVIILIVTTIANKGN